MVITWDLFITYIRDVKHVKCDRHNYNVYHSRFFVVSDYFANTPFNRYTVDQFLASQMNKSHSTVNNYLKIVKNICSALRYYQMEDEEVLRRIEEIPYLPKKRLKQIDILTAQEIKQLAELRMPYKKRRIEINRRWRAIIYTLALGLRVGEITALTWKDYKDEYFIVGEQGKTPDAYRKVYIPSKLKKLIDELPHYEHNHIFGSHLGPLNRESVSEELKMRARILGINKVIYPHVLRHSFIVLALESGMPLQDVMAHVGHKDPKVTIEYAHIGLKQTKKVVEASPIYRSNMLELTKELLKDKIDRVYDKNKLKSLEYLLQGESPSI